MPRRCPPNPRHLPSLILLVYALLSAGCGVSRSIPGHDAGLGSGPLDGAGEGESLRPISDAFGREGGTVCELPRTPLRRVTDPLGAMTLALGSGLDVRVLHFPPGTTGISAMTIDHRRVAAFALSRPGVATLQDHLAGISRSLQTFVGLRGTLRASGTPGTSLDGYPDIKEAVWDLETTTPMDISTLRNELLARTLRLPRSSLGSLPESRPEKTSRFVWTFTLIATPHGTLLSAALASRETHDASVHGERALISDLSNGTALAPGRRRILPTGCDRAAVKTQGKADILWVIDESGSMRDHREAIATHAASFFAKASAAGLDFRMAVTGMVSPEKDDVVLGKFCSTISSDRKDDGGEDRFLLPHEEAIFLSCVRNPPYAETSTEYGLAAILEAMERHLPRKKDRPDRFRTDAKVAIIVVTDEAPQEVKIGSVYGGGGCLEEDVLAPQHCTLEGEDMRQLGDYLAPWVDLLTGRRDPEGRATLHLLGGVCGNHCEAEIPYGYRELVAETAGRQADVCQKDISQTLQLIVDSIVAEASPRRLSRQPISASLWVSVDGVSIPRSRRQGYRYNAGTNTLSFSAVPVSLGSEIVIAYDFFQ